MQDRSDHGGVLADETIDIDRREREIVVQCEEADWWILDDVSCTELQVTPRRPQDREILAHGLPDQRVQDDIDALAVGPCADLVSKGERPRIQHVLNAERLEMRP